MSRTDKLKILYAVSLFGLGGASVGVIYATDKSPIVIGVLVVVFLVPGRICGYYWREFFKGRNLLRQGRVDEAEPLFLSFLVNVRKKPWLKRLIIFSWGIFTRDIEVMTLNNLGVIKIEQGKFQEAEGFLNQAIALDALAPLPYYNMALIAAVDGKKDLAEELLKKAVERGFTGSSTDQLFIQAGELLARVEGWTHNGQVVERSGR